MPHAAAAASEGLVRDALTALDAFLTTLAGIDERAKAQLSAVEMAQTALRRYSNEFAAPPIGRLAEGDATDAERQAISLDQEAIYRDERDLHLSAAHLRSLRDQLDALAMILRGGQLQLQSNDQETVTSVPWASAVRAATLQAQEQERSRLAREVHDGPAQVLANTIHGLEYCERLAVHAPGEVAAELIRLRDQARDGLAEVRGFMFDLRPMMLASQGLTVTLTHYVEVFQRSHPLLTIHLRLPAAEPALATDVQMNLFRIVQESLQNIRKHARADTVIVELASPPDGALILRIIDNGCGFDRSQVKPTSRSGVGLIGMEERARYLGGQLAVASAPGQGTTITVFRPASVQPLDHPSVTVEKMSPLITTHRWPAKLAVETGD